MHDYNKIQQLLNGVDLRGVYRMNINPDKVKQLVIVFSRLNEEYQNKLLSEAYKLGFDAKSISAY